MFFSSMMRPVRCFIHGIVALLVTSSPAIAQTAGAVPLDSGTIVRMTLTSDQVVRGRLLQSFQPSVSESFVFCSYPASPCASMNDPLVRSVPHGQLRKLEVAAGSHWMNGGLIGALIGSALMAGGIAFNNGLCDSSNCQISGLWVLSGGAVGFGIGALFGSTSLRWKPAS